MEDQQVMQKLCLKMEMKSLVKEMEPDSLEKERDIMRTVMSTQETSGTTSDGAMEK